MKNAVCQEKGFSDEVFGWMCSEAERLNIQADGRAGRVCIDDMSIQSGPGCSKLTTSLVNETL